MTENNRDDTLEQIKLLIDCAGEPDIYIASAMLSELKSKMESLLVRKELLEIVAIEIYNTGYQSGHHDTVEGMFTDVLPVDMKTYHSDIVADLLNDITKVP